MKNNTISRRRIFESYGLASPEPRFKLREEFNREVRKLPPRSAIVSRKLPGALVRITPEILLILENDAVPRGRRILYFSTIMIKNNAFTI